MVEKNPWWKNVSGPFPERYTCVGVKTDGGGSMRGRGLVGQMRIHQAVNNRDKNAIIKFVEDGDDVNEVEAAGNTPLFNAAYEGWMEGAELLLQLGAKVNASNNAGDTAWHWARNMRHEELSDYLVKNGATMQQGEVIVPEHVPKVKEFYENSDHPLPSQEFLDWRKGQDDHYEAEKKKLIPGM
mmetsp:Transcript_11631/g.15819  ORF Transcript_11631/g.15819 Transcript_11631/m.15819 type:complete len:184 (-) Transcript_11631:166-717(-)|eukprot:CAMPEP_0196587786 /NCGR_PEP_ID=MMETSP1081-20130531/58590_1 /TAXON_ID=36882 /ORGANISM="Pyramimonas amylifera, Strain CCMP720" /LENGTH=183 /DNA_ID=CAMNT_0041910069 /DNA_START=110 /DNA_END=661 /DNA_ORIENTATION=+